MSKTNTNITSEKIIKLSDLPIGNMGIILTIDDQEMDKNLLRDCWDQGLLPGSSIAVLEVYESQKKMVIQINSSIILAMPIAISEKINVNHS
ncbi:FeoA family protein [Leptospira sp. GIMC2001]|uniref:FeoA family protein n=1 Tax=Leptospira sp. GIMC2001 TaxID=1513297 RepID=UPI00234B2225|nr:FeoA family protein [Leptospira sp. GIMC2001]WCL48615.1 FeoA family protein [Leptospira sp. GIMC2001]